MVEQGQHDEEVLEAPDRGSADELLDAGAHDPIDAMRHSTAHVMAEAVLDLFPGAKLGIGPAIADGFYYDFELPRPLTPEDLELDRGAHARERRRGPSVRAARDRPRRRARGGRGPGPDVQGGDPRRPGGACSRRRRAAARHLLLRARAVQRPVQGAARREHGQDRAVQAPLGRRRVLARRREAPDAAAHLRHGLGDPGGAGRLPVAAGRGEEARPSPPGRPAGPVQLPRREPGLGLLASEGPADLAHARVCDARAPGAPRIPGDQHPDPRPREAVAQVGSPPALRREHVPHGRRGPDVRAEADELPREHVHLPEPGPVVSRPPVALQRVRPAPPERAVRGAVRAHPGAPVHPGRRARLRPAGPAGRRDRGAARRGPRGLRLGRPDAPLRVRHEAGQGARRSGALGTRGGADPRGPRPIGRRVRRQAEGRHVLRARRSTSTSTIRSVASGRWRPSRPT